MRLSKKEAKSRNQYIRDCLRQLEDAEQYVDCLDDFEDVDGYNASIIESEGFPADMDVDLLPAYVSEKLARPSESVVYSYKPSDEDYETIYRDAYSIDIQLEPLTVNMLGDGYAKFRAKENQKLREYRLSKMACNDLPEGMTNMYRDDDDWSFDEYE